MQMRRSVVVSIVMLLITIALGVLVTMAFQPRPLTPMALSYRAPLFHSFIEGKSLELRTLAGLEPSSHVPKPTAVWIPGKRPELAVVVSGLVGEASNSLNFLMVEDVVKEGIPVLILPSPTHWSFAARRLPKDRRIDYRDSVVALCAAYSELLATEELRAAFSKEPHGEPQKVYLMGLSLGARHAVSMSSCFKNSVSQVRVFAVNPPTDLRHAGQTIDELTSRLALNRPKAYAVGVLMETMKPVARWFDLDTALRPLSYFSDSLAYLAGGSFSSRMEQLQTELETPLDGISTRQANFSFNIFMEKGPVTLENFVEELRSVRKRTGNRLFLLHSRDDFLIRPEDLDVVAKALPKRATIVDVGGHGGLVFEPLYRRLVTELIAQ